VVHGALTYRRYVLRRFGFVLGPRWLVLHVVVLTACATMVLLGRWQWRVAHDHHGAVQNYAYALQWWAFTAFALFMWLRVIRDAAPPTAADQTNAAEVTADHPDPNHPATSDGAAPIAATPAEVPYRRYVMPSSASQPPVAADAEHAAYNAYLARLARGAEDDV
jgi:DNA-binding transcriptional regulator of glucitol operon